MNKVFGIGWAKTGTTTLGQCFDILGLDHQGQALDLARDIARDDLTTVIALAKRKEAFEDWPWIILYKELDAAFSDSRFILTTRQPEKWLRSYRNMLKNEGTTSVQLNEVRRILYGLPFANVSEDQLLERYERHNHEVKEYFRERPDVLLVVDWEENDGWAEVCRFLG